MVHASILLLLCISIGYLYYSRHPVHRYAMKRWEGKNLSIKISIAGFFIVFGSLLAWNGIFELFEPIRSPLAIFLAKFRFPTSEFGTSSTLPNFYFMLVPLITVWLLIDASLVKYQLDSPRKLAQQSMDTLESMLLDEQREATTIDTSDDRLVRLVLDNDKVYIGYVLRPDIENGAISHVEIAPVFSGYLDASKRSLELNSFYSAHYLNELPNYKNNLSQLFEKYAVIIPTKHIVTASLFDINDHLSIRSGSRDK